MGCTAVYFSCALRRGHFAGEPNRSKVHVPRPRTGCCTSAVYVCTPCPFWKTPSGGLTVLSARLWCMHSMLLRQVRQREATGRDRRGRSHQASNGTNGRVEAAEPPEKEPEDEGAWPASLRRYLQRAFDKCDKKQGSRQHALLEKALHRKVTDAMANNEMLRKDWDNEPLPRCALAPHSVGGGVIWLIECCSCF